MERRTRIAATAVSAVLLGTFAAQAAFGDSDEDRALREARERASRPSAASEAGPDRDLFLPLALSLIPGSPIPGVRVDAGLGLAPIMTILDDVYGAQAAGVGALATGTVYGAQAAGIFCIAAAEVNGVQAAGIFSIGDGGIQGAQLSGIFNLSSGPFDGFQGAGIFNIAEGGARDPGGFSVQAAGIFNLASGRFDGIQSAGIFNVADEVRGVQAAAIFNVAKEVRGIQIGLVNISEDMYGIPIGLVNIVKNGIFDLGAWVDQDGMAYGFLQRGSRDFYSLVYAGVRSDELGEGFDSLAAGAGFGYRIRAYNRWGPQTDLDLGVKGAIDAAAARNALAGGADYWPDFFPSFRGSLRLPLGSMVALHGGLIIDADLGTWTRVPEPFRAADPWEFECFGQDVVLHPKLFLGLSL